MDLPVQRVECTRCQAVRQVKIQFADEHKRHTRSFERLVLDLSRHMTIQAVARHLGVSWDLVKGIQKDNLNKRYRLPKLAKIKRIALDEIYQGKKLLFNDSSGSSTWGSDFCWQWERCRCTDSVLEAFETIGARIEAVATDMGPAYISAVRVISQMQR
ncbi:MAG: transposase family protein [Nitrosomonas sp.]|nr:transposase family protein [Nitrosomonas sp.]